MSTIADAHIYFWLPLDGLGANYIVGQNNFDEHGPGSRCKRQTVKHADDQLSLSDVVDAAYGITSGGIGVGRQSDIGVHYYNIKTSKIQSLAPTSAETFTFWFEYSSSSITQTIGTHHLIETDNYSIDITFDQTTKKAKINGTTIEPNRWYHITITHEIIGNYINEKIYLNGGTDGVSESHISLRTLNTDNLYLLGKGLDATNTPLYTYYVSDFRWYGIKLTEEDILEKGTDRLILHYALDHIPKGIYVSNCSRAALYDYHIRAHLEDSSTDYHYEMPPALSTNSNTINAPYENTWDFVHSSKYYFLRGYDLFDNIGGTPKTFCIWYKPYSSGVLFALNERDFLGLNRSEGWIFRTWSKGTHNLGKWGMSSSKFYHLAVVVNYSTISFYLDGELQIKITWDSGGLYPYEDLHIGHNDLWDGNRTDELGTWRGTIADFRMYAKILSQEEIQTLAQHPGVHLGLKNNNLLYAGDLIEEDAEQVEVKSGHRTIRVKDFIETESNEIPNITENGTFQGLKLHEV